MAVIQIPNADFSDGLDNWSTSVTGPGTPSVTWSATGGTNTPGCVLFTAFSDNAYGTLLMEEKYAIVPGKRITATAQGRIQEGSSGSSFRLGIVWYDVNGGQVGTTYGSQPRRSGIGGNVATSTASGFPPPGAVRANLTFWFDSGTGTTRMYADTFRWDAESPDVTLSSPNGETYAFGSIVPFRVAIPAGLQITSVEYFAQDQDLNETSVGTSIVAPWGINSSTLEAGSYTARAEVTLASGLVINTNTTTFTVGTPPEPITREYKASNSYTYLIGENFIGLGGAMPPTARVLGVEVLVDYSLEVLVRSKDVGVSDPAEANYDVAFDIINGGTVEAVLLSNSNGSYTQLGSPMSSTLSIERTDFTVQEDGLSEGKRWTVLSGGQGQVVIGDEDELFSLPPDFGSTFIDYGIGIRFTPNLGTVPSYAAAGDAAYRFHVESFKVRVYFDAGSVEYYFASPDKSQVLKGTLAAYYVYTGNFRTNDASGVLQLTSELEQMDGTQRWIGSDWTIHSSYPPTDNNQIGEVGEVQGELGMKYNALPTQQQVLDNRSRYEFKTENFYGDPDLNSMYGVHGLPRAFAFNGDFFYKIYTQADAEKDSPRHVANHHGHLALGYYGGRVDISVVGEPYNFNGVDGASSWAFGDKVVGLLPLSGTILGVFGAKSVWGISGTTVDNFATQVISPNMGAVEYTITDMGFPVYANAYGIYTLNQTQQYGDYLGQPMSQDISPWLRPRLIRKLTSDKEVVCAYPVRSKNQYRLCFSDGYVTSMTLNGRQVPTFSFQKYFYAPEGVELPDDLFSYPSIVPAAVSSELDESGEERIHIAPVEKIVIPDVQLVYAVAVAQLIGG